MYTIKDIASKSFTLLHESDLVRIEEVKAVGIMVRPGELKIITIYIGFWNYFLGRNLRNTLRVKLLSDMPGDYIVRFGI